MRVRPALASALVMLLAAPFPAAAEAGGVLSGVVKSVTGSTLANVDIEFVDLASGVAHTVRSDGAGGLRGVLANGSYSVQARGYSIVSGPRTATVKDGEVTSVDLTLQGQDPAALPAGGSTPATVGEGGRRTANIVALSVFSGALTAAAIRAATVKQPADRKPPVFSPSR